MSWTRNILTAYIVAAPLLSHAGVSHVDNLLDDPSFTSMPMAGMPTNIERATEAFRYHTTGASVQIQTKNSTSQQNDTSSFTATINIFDDMAVVSDPEYSPATTTLDGIVPNFSATDISHIGIADLNGQNQNFEGWYEITLTTTSGVYVATSATANLFSGTANSMTEYVAEQWNQLSWDTDPFANDGIVYTAINSIGIEFFHKTTVPNTTDSGAWFTLSSATIGYEVSILDTIAPAAPIELVAMKGNNRAFLDWKSNWDVDLASYSVYRNSTSGSGYSLVASNIVASAYTDTTATNGTVYYYIVSATDKTGNESENSNESMADNTVPHDLTDAPNIVVIFSDDHGYADVGYRPDGSTDVVTPRIDSIAAGGIQFNTGYVSCNICAPSRAGLLTGNYQNRFGFEDNPSHYQVSAEIENGIPSSEYTIAERLRSLGYTTGMIGKWHTLSDLSMEPNANGFDEFFGFNNGASNYRYSDRRGYKINGDGNPIQRNSMKTEGTYQYLTDEFGDQAESFIDRYAEEPFFLYLAFNAIHGPMQTTDEYYNLPLFDGIVDHDRRVMVSMLYAMDLAVGQVLDALDRHGLTENTLVIFLSDNGGLPGTVQKSSNLPLRGTKTQMWDGGIRIPFCMQWPTGLPVGQTVDYPVISLDILPTAIAAAGGMPDHTIDGVNLLPYLRNEVSEEPHDYLCWRRMPNWAIRNSDWKLLYQDGVTNLFNISADISETHDLYDTEPLIRDQLQAEYDAWESEMSAPNWGGGRPYTNTTTTATAHPTSIEEWLKANYWLYGDDLALEADPDGDGFNNLIEYATGHSPTDAQNKPGNPLSFEAGIPHLSYPALLGTDTTPFPLTYSMEFREQLTTGTWTTASLTPVGSPTTNFNGRTVEQAQEPAFSTEPQGFFRLKISTP